MTIRDGGRVMTYSGLAILTELLYIGLTSHNEYTETGHDEDSKPQLIIGGLFPVHEQGTRGLPCGPLSEGRGIHRVEAMLFAIDSINRDPDILPGIQLGARIFDTCSNPSHALNLSLVFVRDLMGAEHSQYFCLDGSDAQLIDERQPVAGIIGGSYSGVSIQTAHLFRLFNIVQISPASTNADLSDKNRFNLFARTVPSDIFQARVLADIAHRYNWTYVSLVYSAGEYGDLGAEAFKREAKRLNVCIALEAKISKYEDLAQIVTGLIALANDTWPVSPRVVVMFTRSDDTRQLLSHARFAPPGLITWLAADGWEMRSTTTRGWEKVADGALVITLEAKPVVEFEEYFLSLRPHSLSAKRNPWFNEFWREKFNCTFREDDQSWLKKCRHGLRLTRDQFQADDKVQFVIDAVYALAHALHRMIIVDCKGHVCSRMRPINGSRLYQTFLMNVTFRSIVRLQKLPLINVYRVLRDHFKWRPRDLVGNLVHFDEHGDGPAYYRIMRYQRNVSSSIADKRYGYSEIGAWSSSYGLNMHSDALLLSKLPTSKCSVECAPGNRKELSKGEAVCCWGCFPCLDHQYTSDDVCVDCERGEWPTEDRQDCRKLSVAHMQWISVYSLVPCCLATAGLVILIFIVFTLMYYRKTPLIKAAGTELCYVLLAGAAICYFMVYVLLAKPTALNCGLRRVGVGLGFAVIYSSLLVKTNRIYRIFHGVTNADCRPKFISSVSQLVITGMLISVQLLGSLMWLAVQPPMTKIEYPARNVAVLQCNTEDTWFLVSLTYDALLIVICTVYAVKTRTVPENFNEAKFIGFAMYTTCVIWLAFVPLYFGTGNNFRIQITTLSVCISLSATVSTLCIFAPKLWVVFMEPERNVRRHSGAWLNSALQASGGYNSNSPADTPLLSKRGSADKSYRTPSSPASSSAVGSKATEEVGNHYHHQCQPGLPLLRVNRCNRLKSDILESL